MNPCELVARLNPGSVRLDGGGRGGVPEYTAQDIAAMLGMMGNDPDGNPEENERLRFAREIFCAVWWPEGAKLVKRQLDALIGAMQFEEWRERANDLLNAHLAVAQSSILPVSEQRFARERADGILDRAKARLWPALGQSPYVRIRSAVLVELRATRICAICEGRGQAMVDTLKVTCGSCGGSGRIAISDVQRAGMLERDESTYRHTWRSVYEWTFARVSEADALARSFLADGLNAAA
jgi:hypothetical protein